MAMSANSEWLDQFEEGNAAGGHAGEVEAIPFSHSMTSRRFPPAGAPTRCRAAMASATPTDRPLQRQQRRSAAGEGALQRRGGTDRRQRRAAGALRERALHLISRTNLHASTVSRSRSRALLGTL